MERIQAASALSALTLLLTTPPVGAHHDQFDVVSDVVSRGDMQDIHVWAPMDEGAYPIVYAIHGTGGFGTDWDVIANELAQRGVVVFAPDYHSGDADVGRWDRIIADLECGYRFVREIAPDYGGDLDRPLVTVGHSLGASLGLGGALDVDQLGPGGTYDVCLSGAVRPDATVAMAGCYYEYDGRVFPFNATGLGSGDASIVMVGAEHDEVCAPWQSIAAVEALDEAGFDATYIEVPGAKHLTLIGHDFVDDEWLTLPDEPAAAAVIEIIIDTITSAGG